jgi:O-antigen/teichoic acid export membrane protein
MQKQFFSSLFLTVLLNLLIKPIAIFAIDATVQNRVGQAEYGLYFTLLNLTVIFNIFLDFGINNYTTKMIAQNPLQTGAYFGNLMAFRFVLFVLYCIVIFSIAFLLGYQWREFYLLFFLVFNQLLILSIAFFRSHFSGLHLFKTDAIISVLDKALLIILAGATLIVLKGNFNKIDWFVYTQTGCYFATFVIAAFLLRKKINGPLLRWSPMSSLLIIKKSFPYALLVLLMLLYSRSDAVLLERLHENGRVEAGYYAQGYRLLDAVYMFGMIFASLLFPMFSRLLKEAPNEVVLLLKTSGNLLIGGAIVIVAITTFNAEWLLALIYTNVNDSALFSFCLLMVCFIPISMNFIFGTLLTANGSLKTLNIISFIGVAINVVINCYLLPTLGAKGAAISALITHCFVASIQFYFASRIISFRIILNDFIKYFLLIGILVGSGLLTIYFSVPHTLIVLLQLLLGGTLLVVLSFIDVKQLKTISFFKQLNNNSPSG